LPAYFRLSNLPCAMASRMRNSTLAASSTFLRF
jgi:hypothetical protein